jgi:hypothetical protein
MAALRRRAGVPGLAWDGDGAEGDGDSGGPEGEDGAVVGGIKELKELFEACGLKECVEFDAECGGTAFVNGA